MFKTLAARLALSYAAIFLVSFASAFLFFYFFIDATLVEEIDDDLEEDIAEFRDFHDSEGVVKVIDEIRREVATSEADTIFFRLLDGAGNMLFASDTLHWPSLEQIGLAAYRDAREDSSEPQFSDVTGKGDAYRTRMATGKIGAGLYLQIGETMEDKEEFMEMLFRVFAVTFLFVMVFAALIGLVTAKRALAGVEKVSQAAEDVANGSLERQVKVEASGEEVDRLAATFNIMVGKIRALIASMREMTDNIAHDMRSPLARIRSNTELALSSSKTVEEYRASAVETMEECDRLMEMINTTLDIAEAEAGIADIEKEDVDISMTVQQACELFEPVAADREIALSSRLEPDRHVLGNIQHLQRMLANLLDNALKYTSPKGSVDVAMQSDDETVSISVRDNGAGISENEQHHIFDRFFRCDQSRSLPGFGLGLSFSRAVARTHGGEIEVLSNIGSGSVFTVTLPLCK